MNAITTKSVRFSAIIAVAVAAFTTFSSLTPASARPATPTGQHTTRPTPPQGSLPPGNQRNPNSPQGSLRPIRH